MSEGTPDALGDLGERPFGVTNFRIRDMPECEAAPLAKGSPALETVGRVLGMSFSIDRMVHGSLEYAEDVIPVRR